MAKQLKPLRHRLIRPFIFVAVGGFFVALGSFASYAIFWFNSLGTANELYPLLGFFFGILLIVAGFEIDSDRARHVEKWSVVAIVSSLLSILLLGASAYGGFVFGFLVALLGGFVAYLESQYELKG